MSKKLGFIFLIVLISIFVWLLVGNHGPQSSKPKGATSASSSVTAQSDSAQTVSPLPQASTSPSPPSTNSPESYKLEIAKQVDGVVDRRAPAEETPYKLLGYGSSGRIVDAQGKVILQSGEQSGLYIYDCQVDPGGKQIYVHCANSIDFILDPKTGQQLPLPLSPPSPAGATIGGLESWHWLNGETLIAKASEWKPKDQSTKFDDDEANIARTRLYIFRITDQRLTEAVLPQDLNATVLSIVEVSPLGQVHLTYHIGNAPSSNRSTWFSVRTR
jgi:hypothetical protein